MKFAFGVIGFLLLVIIFSPTAVFALLGGVGIGYGYARVEQVAGRRALNR